MEKQSGGELASTDAAAGAQDAALQELWLSAEIPVEPCSRLQHLQRPTPSHLGSDTPDATRRGDENMARGRRSDVRIPVANGSCSGCFRLERSPGGALTHWKAPPSHGARK